MTAIKSFGPFRLDVAAGMLLRGGEPVALGQRAVALLRALIEEPGAPISKDTLIESAWPGLAIEESNLTVQIPALRRVFAGQAFASGVAVHEYKRGPRARVFCRRNG